MNRFDLAAPHWDKPRRLERNAVFADAIRARLRANNTFRDRAGNAFGDRAGNALDDGTGNAFDGHTTDALVDRAGNALDDHMTDALVNTKIGGLRGLEYGCGTAALGLEAQDLFRELLLVDSSAGMIAEVNKKLDARRSNPRTARAAAGRVRQMRALQWDLSEEPLTDVEVDVVFSSLAFHHIHAVEQVLTNIRALLPVGGRLMIIDMDEDEGFWHRDQEEFNGHHGFDRGELTKWCEAAGFRVDSVETIHSMTKRMEDGPHQVPLFLLDAVAV